MPIQVPPSPSATQVPEFARRFEDLKVHVRTSRRHGRSASIKREKMTQDSGSSRRVLHSPSPSPATKTPRVRLPRKQLAKKASRESGDEVNWAFRSAGIAVVASLAVSVLANIVMMGMDGGNFANGALNVGDFASKVGWHL